MKEPEHRLSDALMGGEVTALLSRAPEPLPFEEVARAWRASLDRRGAAGAPQTLQVYVHFAYCSMHCSFCQCWHALHKSDARLDDHVSYLVSTLDRYRSVLGRQRASNAAFGGGTPTLLTHAQLQRFVDAFGRAFSVSHDMAWEGHPATLDDDKLEILARSGANRLSMGLQSLDPAVLHTIGRTNDTKERVEAVVRGAQTRGMFVNLDLVAGLPLQRAESVVEDAFALMDMRPEMLTLYRYQPVRRLPAPPDATLSLPKIITRSFLLRAAARGFVPVNPITECGASALFMRVGRRTTRVIGRELWAHVSKRELPRYSDLDRGDVNLLGIGTGALSHLVGFGFYRDVRSLRSTSPEVEPLYWGSRTTPELEVRAALLMALGRRASVSIPALEYAFGASLDGALQEVSNISQSYEIARHGSSLRWGKHVSPARRAEILRGLLRERVDAHAQREAAERAHTFREREDVQGDIVEVHATASDAGPLVQLRKRARHPALVSRFVDELGLRTDERVERIDDDGISLRIEPTPHKALRLIIDPPDAATCFFRTAAYAVSYEGKEPSSREVEALESLRARALRAAAP